MAIGIVHRSVLSRRPPRRWATARQHLRVRATADKDEPDIVERLFGGVFGKNDPAPFGLKKHDWGHTSDLANVRRAANLG